MAFSIKHTISSIYVLVILTCTASFLIRDQECLALFEFKQTILPQNYRFHKFDSWRKITGNASLSGYDCCLWDGVVCSNKGHVIGLDLSRGSLTGVINSSSSLFKLVHLEMLNLSMNNFVESQIPSEIARLNQLRSLDLSSSGFIGQIPNDISQLMQLSSLNLSGNPLKLQRSHGLEYLLQNLTRLEILNLSGINLSSSVPRFLAIFSSLRFIALRGCNLKGEFPSEIFHLPKLKYLDMGNNSELTGSLPEFHNNTLLKYLSLFSTGFTGIVPESISNLNNLQVLALHMCDFTGLVPEISQLMQLSYLSLSGNPLMLQSSQRLEYLLQNLTGLEILGLSGVHLRSSVPRFLANFSSLRYIELSDCQLQGEFPSAIFHLPNLKYLDVGNNSNLTGSLPEFHNNTSLKYISLFSTGFNGNVPESISNLRHLEFLSLQFCNFSGRIPGSLPNLTQLTFLTLVENKFTGLVPSLASLSKLNVLALGLNSFEVGSEYSWINKLTKLNSLYLSDMNIHDEILPYLANLTKLRVFEATDNFIFGHIPSSFTNLTQLMCLDLEYNQLQGQISSSFMNFKDIRYLNIGYNNFSGIVGIDSFVGLNKLEYLSINGNRLSFVTKNYTNRTLPELEYLGLSFCNLNEFPAFLQFHSKMKGLFLGYNEIEGLIPNWIWNNSRETLQILDLSYNFIIGFHQHPRFLPWIHLHVFDMSYNRLLGWPPIPPKTIIVYDVSNNNLIGEMPSFICEKKSLQVLALSANKMTGTLPPCSSNLSNSLVVLDLKGNNFHGPMMKTCTQGSLLKTIDLSENKFTGQVSKSLANCNNLEYLSLADNSFKDLFPLWLGKLPKLQVLLLRSNKFYGAIENFSTVSSPFLKLRVIDISNNYFTGQLPDNSFKKWNAMKSINAGESSAMGSHILTIIDVIGKHQYWFPYSMMLTNKGVKREYQKILNIFTAIDLSCNNFEGLIPQSLQDLHGLESLNLSNNHFSGHILPSFGNMRNLESLDLSQNELSGQIPQQMLQLGFLAFLNVSFNHLDGHIPQGEQFNTFENNSYLGNHRLCGKPLSNECEKSKVSTLHPPTSSNEYESLMPGDIFDWMVILLGVLSGLVMGIAIGNWLLKQFEMKKDRWVRPLRNNRRH